MAGGRKNIYESHVKCRFEEIEKWVSLGWTEKKIYNALGISHDSWIRYKKQYPELSELIIKSRQKPVEEIKAAMLKRATGFQYEEKKVITQRIEFDDGTIAAPAKLIRTEVTTKTALPDVGAGLVLLQHWAKDEGWTRDPQQLELKKKELALKEKQAEDANW